MKLPSSDYTITGSLTGNNKKWCFNLKEGSRQAYYNQNGFVIDTFGYTPGLGWGFLGRSACLDGIAYDNMGEAILGLKNTQTGESNN